MDEKEIHQITTTIVTGDASALADTADQFRRRYQDTSWAKKASVWGMP